MLSRGWRFLFLAAAIAPAALPLFVIWRYGVNMPYMDEWDFIKDLHLANQQNRLFQHLFTQFNESRPALSRLLFLALAKLSGGDFRAPMVASWFAACLIAWNLWRLAKPATSDALHLATMAFANLLIFSPIQHETWLWGNQVIVLLPMLFLTTALRVLGKRNLAPWISLGSALALGAAAMYSFSGGLFVLPAIGAALFFVWPHWTTHKRPAIATWMATFILCAGFYFYGYVTPPNHPGMGAALQSPLKTIRYFLMFLGSIHGNGEAFVTVLAGLALLVTLVAVARWHGNRSILIVVGFVLVSAGATAVGRVGLGLEQALSYRYMSVSLYLTVGLATLALRAPSRTLLALLTGALAATSVHGCIRGLVLSAADYRAKQYARTCVSVSRQSIDGCSEFAPYPGWDFLRANAPVLERLGLFKPGLFAGQLANSGGPPAGTMKIEETIKGTVDNATEPAHAVLLFYEVQGGPPRLFATALPSMTANRQWETALKPPQGAEAISAYTYNADSGHTAFLAKALQP